MPPRDVIEAVLSRSTAPLGTMDDHSGRWERQCILCLGKRAHQDDEYGTACPIPELAALYGLDDPLTWG